MKRRNISIFGLSFLDVMFCGFGSVILLVMIVNSQAITHRKVVTSNLQGETDRLEREVLEGRRMLVELKNTLEDIEKEEVKTEGRAERIIREITQRKEEVANLEEDTLADREHVNKLKSELKSLEEERKRLEQSVTARERQGDKVRSFQGQGDRQYLTGMKMGGQRIFILVDASASMLDETIVNILRLRHMPEDQQRGSRKWRQAVATVEWLVSQLPTSSQYQILSFNETSKPLLDGTQSTWLAASNTGQLNDAIQQLHRIVPEKGTSLVNAFNSIKSMQPPPDNIFLITDGLPTWGKSRPVGNRISSKQRLAYFDQALRSLPKGIPVNSILLPMEGDPMAPSAFWKLATLTRGSFVNPAEDWP